MQEEETRDVMLPEYQGPGRYVEDSTRGLRRRLGVAEEDQSPEDREAENDGHAPDREGDGHGDDEEDDHGHQERYVKMPKKKKKKKRKSFWKELRSILKQELLICLMKLRTNSQVILQVWNLTLSLELAPFPEKIYKVTMAVNQQELVENYPITTF